MEARRVLALAALLVGGGLAVPAVATPPAPACPVQTMTGFLQNDAGSGRDAGDVRDGAVPLLHEEWSWGNLDPPLAYGFQDLQDWFTLDVPQGERNITVKVVFLPNYYYGDDAVPVFYSLDVWRAGQEFPVHETISYLPPTSFQEVGGERLWLRVYEVPLSIASPCLPGSGLPMPSTGLLPADIGAYGLLVRCNPACL